MSINMLVFDYRDTEQAFFGNNHFQNFNIRFFKESLNEQTVKTLSQEDLDGVMIISVFIDSEVTEDVINSFKNLRIISTRSTGIDHINAKAAEKRNIKIINVMNYGSTSVAQYTFGLMLALVRNIVYAANCAKRYNERSIAFMGRDVSVLTLGVVGTGAIGGAVCKLAAAFGMKIYAYDYNERQELKDACDVEYVSLEHLLKCSDVVTLHLPYTGTNKNMISYSQFAMMKPNSYLINTSRGEMVDIKALKMALDDGQIKGVALDVLSCENYNVKCEELVKDLEGIPLECHEEVKITQEIIRYPNVIITPHIAYDTQEAVDYILQKTFDGIIDTIKGGTEYCAV